MRVHTGGPDIKRWLNLVASIALASLTVRTAAGCRSGSGDASCPGLRPTCWQGPSDCCGDDGVAATCTAAGWACPSEWVSSCSGHFVPLHGCSTNGAGTGGSGGTGACAGTSPTCWEGPSDCCGDVYTSANCTNGAWSCRQGYVASCSAFYMETAGACFGGPSGRGGAGGIGGAAGTEGTGGRGGASGSGGAAGAPGTGGAGGATGCARVEAPGAPCAAGWYHDVETVCAADGSQCADKGDGLCYRQCISDEQCPDPCFSKCTVVPAFNSGGADGASYYVCRKR